VIAMSNAVYALIYMDSYSPSALEFARQVLQSVKVRLQRTVSIAISDSFPLKEMAKAYAQGAARLKQRIRLGGDRIVREDQKLSAQIEQYPYDMERQLETAIRFGDRAKMKETLRAMLRQLTAHDMPSDFWQQITFDIIERCYQVAREIGLSSATAQEMIETSREITLVSTQEDIQLWLESSLGALVERIRSFGAGPSLAVKKALSFIEGHFREPVRLADVAEHVCLSPNYLTQQLKLQTGKSFLEHVSLMRLEAAKHLLTRTTMSVSEIAHEVGYETPRHFSEVFRRRSEITPSRFRSCSPVEKLTHS
jgi:two-component system response regulator YesN